MTNFVTSLTGQAGTLIEKPIMQSCLSEATTKTDGRINGQQLFKGECLKPANFDHWEGKSVVHIGRTAFNNEVEVITGCPLGSGEPAEVSRIKNTTVKQD